MKETGFKLYQQGIMVSGEKLNDSLSHVQDILEDVKAERAIRQPDFWGEVWFKKVDRWVAEKRITYSIGRYEGE